MVGKGRKYMIKFRELNKTENEIKAYHKMRCELYIKTLGHIQHSEQDLYDEMLLILKGECFYKNELSWHIFVAENDMSELVGFIELSIYPELSFCDSKPIGYIEAWFVDDKLRNQGVGKGLVKFVEEWLKGNNIVELASDAEILNESSHKAHKAVGFIEAYTDIEGIFYKKFL